MMSAGSEPAYLFLFWSAAVLLAYTYAGFWILLIARAWLWPLPVVMGTSTPAVSLLIPVHNEGAFIASKLENSLGLDYPPELLEIIVASDGSDDSTEEIAASYATRGVRLLRLPRQGKNATIAAAAAATGGDVLVFTDADSMLALDALRHLTAALADPQVGAAAGDYRHESNAIETVGDRMYWNYDRELKRLQGRAGSLTAVSGALYAVRRELFVTPPPGVADDFFIAAQVGVAGRRVVFVPEAVAVGPAGSPAEDFDRRARVIARGLRAVWLSRTLLNPLTYGFHAVQLLTHKVLRRLMVLPLFVLLASSLALWHTSWFYRVAALLQLTLHAGAACGYALMRLDRRSPKILRILLHIEMSNLACLAAMWTLLSGRRRDVWSTARVKSKASVT
jgi:cellulose synthase/poly-beta-1,6-N-acetylglucosamine synthase-like glycosyltransferase